ncbi:uncharacterized protein Z520_04418 [Fonsecaea multimorphosa CBS 102226]|uniref:Uncharacterized protein n=1 Tax=Fonsecaea multimorphosa CBS 102226 TaxID=1442371 RepID=A0A0D2K1N8_9EURO|nr:uncharacterized protein Z520_04418 [Fonsecaea multimorphosa CBS 102226]KIX99782.1 hypothetical protein Z520_04418 [Fonsecaea multimorphosa CBS 102226]OAL26570.1 hypothetical protein AYO22_04181 [Fonsecaea multimorphosa]
MVFIPTSPVRIFARQQVVIHPQTPKPSKEGQTATAAKKINEIPPADMPESRSPTSGWRGGVSRLMRQAQDRPHTPPKEVSRWSKTTTESEISDAFPEPPSSLSDRRRSFLKKKSKMKRQSMDTTNSSPTDPFYGPVNRQLEPIGDIPPVLSSSRYEEPKAMDATDSDASSELDPTSPVIHRASSVRVSKPHIVQHSNSSGGSVPKLYAPHSTTISTNDGPSIAETSQTLGEDLKNVSDLTPAVEKTDKSDILGGPSDALKALEGQQEPQQKDDESITALPQVAAEVSNEHRDTMKETILEWPDTPSRIEALDTLPTPFGGFGSLRVPRTSDATYSTSGSTYVSPSIVTDGLRSNPPTENDKKLSRAISAPVRNPARRVMIRPADLLINKGTHDHKLFRENIVSTPYPARHSSIGEIDGFIAPPGAQEGEMGNKTPKLRRARPLSHHTEKSAEHYGEGEGESETNDNNTSAQVFQDDEKRDDGAPEIPFSTKPTTLLSPTPAVPPHTAKSDRFPSPSAPEILFLDLRLARHPSAQVTVEIEVSDRATFDDEQLFTIVRDSYVTKLMGRTRWWFCARTLEGASTGTDIITQQGFSRGMGLPFWQSGLQQQIGAGAGNGNGAEFDGADFVRHVLNPRVGRRRKMWLLWLRNNQSLDSHSNNNNNNNNNGNANNGPARRGRSRRSYLPHQNGYGHGYGYGYGYGYSPQQGDATATSPVFSFVHSRTNSDGVGNTEASPTTIQATAGAGAGAGGLNKQPSISLPRMPFQSGPSNGPAMFSFHRTKSLASALTASNMPMPPSSTHSSPSTTTTNPHLSSYPMYLPHHHQASGPPTIYLHHTFSLLSILLSTLVVSLLSCLTATFWILFGYPGRSAAVGNGETVVAGQEFLVSWRRDAQSRVGVGLVMGVVVMLLGMGCEVGWIWASWVLV